jgi:regulator of RNase E activity RraA
LSNSDVFNPRRTGHPSHGAVRADIERAPADLISSFAPFGTAAVADALAGAGVIDHHIRAIRPDTRFCGSAITVWTRPGDALFTLKATELVRERDVVVIDAGGDADVGSAGEIFAGDLRARRAHGLVVDGLIRDVSGIAQLGLPTFARGTSPRFYGLNGPGAINVPIQCGGVSVDPGDIVLGDEDGVVVVPQADARDILRRVEERMAAEQEWLEQLRSGKSIVEVYDINARLHPSE